MVSVAQNNLRTDFMEVRGRQRFHRSLRSHRHEDRRLDRAMPCPQTPTSRGRRGVGLQKLERLGTHYVGKGIRCGEQADQAKNSPSFHMNYHLLGRSGLRISTFALGTMTFGTEWGWGASEETARALFNAYLDGGANCIDTADLYTNGTSEQFLGKFIRERNARDHVVLATKYSFGAAAGNPNAGGNGRKNLLRAIEGSLRRLQTDYIDVYWV